MLATECVKVLKSDQWAEKYKPIIFPSKKLSVKVKDPSLVNNSLPIRRFRGAYEAITESFC